MQESSLPELCELLLTNTKSSSTKTRGCPRVLFIRSSCRYWFASRSSEARCRLKVTIASRVAFEVSRATPLTKARSTGVVPSTAIKSCRGEV